MRASDRLPVKCQRGEYVILDAADTAGEMSRIMMERDRFDSLFADIADAEDFVAALDAHALTQTPAWRRAIEWIKSS